MRTLSVVTAMLVSALPAFAGTEGVIYKSPSCSCCEKWVDHMQRAGFNLTPVDLSTAELMQQKLKFGVTGPQASCHTAQIEGYTIEGHVPADDVKRLLAERPEAIGLSVPDMPAGSPGMEAGDAKDPYDVLLLKKDGTTEVFAKH